MKKVLPEKRTRAADHCRPKTSRVPRKPYKIECHFGTGNFPKATGWRHYRSYATRRARDEALVGLQKGLGILKGHMTFRAGTP